MTFIAVGYVSLITLNMQNDADLSKRPVKFWKLEMSSLVLSEAIICATLNKCVNKQKKHSNNYIYLVVVTSVISLELVLPTTT